MVEAIPCHESCHSTFGTLFSQDFCENLKLQHPENINVVSRLKKGKPLPPAEPPKSKPINKMLGGDCSHNFNIPCSFSLHKTISDISQN